MPLDELKKALGVGRLLKEEKIVDRRPKPQPDERGTAGAEKHEEEKSEPEGAGEEG